MRIRGKISKSGHFAIQICKRKRNHFIKHYRQAKKISARMVARAQAAAKQDLYEELETSDDSVRIFKIAAMRKNLAKGLTSPKYIENEQGRLLSQGSDTFSRWKEYTDHLLNEEFPRTSVKTENPVFGPVELISLEEVEAAVQKMKKNKAVGLDGIPAKF